MENDPLSIDGIMNRTSPTDAFLVGLEGNTADIHFVGFKLRNPQTDEIYHEFTASNIYDLDIFADEVLSYVFPMKVLTSASLGAELRFMTGDAPIKNLVLIEKHFVEGEQVKSYDFDFPFFMPNSENAIEFIYDMPKFSEDINNRIKTNTAFEASSDTFIFVEGKLIMHRRAIYLYSD